MYKLTQDLIFDEVRLSAAIIDAARPLLRRHYEEVAAYKDIPLDPDWEMYTKAEQAGLLCAFVVRDRGVLKGYAVYFLRQNPHYKTSLQATQDVLFLDASLRGGSVSGLFIQWCDEQLAARGVQVVYHHVKFTRDFGARLSRLGYAPIEVIWGKRLDA